MQHIRSIISGGLIATLLAAFPGSPVAGSTFPGNNGLIAYGKGRDLYAIDPETNQKRLLVTNAQTPRWSPDGQKLAFINYRQHLQIKTIYNQQRSTAVTHGTAIDSSPAWSRDGSRVAFVRTKQTKHETKSAIFIVRYPSLVETNVSGWSTSSVFASPSWSPDGARLVFEKRTASKRTLIIKNLATRQEHTVTTLSDDIDSNVSWSPNGQKLLYNDSSNEVYTIWTDGSHRTVISDGESYQATWSPDGTRIAFLESPTDESISISELDGSITYLPITKGDYQTIHSPTWSPDGNQILFAMQTNQNGTTISDLFTIQLQQQNAQPQKRVEGIRGDTNWQSKR